MSNSPNGAVGTVLTILNAVLGVADIADPALGVPLTAISKLLAGVAAAEPTALALISQLKSSVQATQADLATAILAYHATDDQFAADLKADGAT